MLKTLKTLKTIFMDAVLAKESNEEVVLIRLNDYKTTDPLPFAFQITINDSKELVERILECLEEHGDEDAGQILDMFYERKEG